MHAFPSNMPRQTCIGLYAETNAPIKEVWPLLSTCEGVSLWWIAPVTRFDLKRGGAFVHHWTNTVKDLSHHRLIDFDEAAGDYAGTGGLRFEVTEPRGGVTEFELLTTFGPEVVAPDGAKQPHGPGTAWADVSAGWHMAADALERVVNGQGPCPDKATLITFYERYLERQFQLIDMLGRHGSTRVDMGAGQAVKHGNYWK